MKNRILAIGGGKGGTGKSLIAASLGICLAHRGHEVLLIDADLGTANLHTFFGLAPPALSLSDFVTKKTASLDGVIIPTGVNNLKLISGAKDMIGIANLTYAQKNKVLNNIKKLKYKYILIDLGPGTSFNILDFFLVSHSGILITSPEPTSIENTYRFIKGLLFRYLRKMINQNMVKSLIDKGVGRAAGQKFESVFDLLEAVESIDPKLGGTIAHYLSTLDIKLIANQATTNHDSMIGRKMALVAEKYFGIHIEFLGNVRHDREIKAGLLTKKPLTAFFPHSHAFRDIDRISQRILPKRQLQLDFASLQRGLEAVSFNRA